MTCAELRPECTGSSSVSDGGRYVLRSVKTYGSKHKTVIGDLPVGVALEKHHGTEIVGDSRCPLRKNCSCKCNCGRIVELPRKSRRAIRHESVFGLKGCNRACA